MINPAFVWQGKTRQKKERFRKKMHLFQTRLENHLIKYMYNVDIGK